MGGGHHKHHSHHHSHRKSKSRERKSEVAIVRKDEAPEKVEKPRPWSNWIAGDNGRWFYRARPTADGSSWEYEFTGGYPTAIVRPLSAAYSLPLHGTVPAYSQLGQAEAGSNEDEKPPAKEAAQAPKEKSSVADSKATKAKKNKDDRKTKSKTAAKEEPGPRTHHKKKVHRWLNQVVSDE